MRFGEGRMYAVLPLPCESRGVVDLFRIDPRLVKHIKKQESKANIVEEMLKTMEIRIVAATK